MVYRSGGEWGPVLLAESRLSLQVQSLSSTQEETDLKHKNPERMQQKLALYPQAYSLSKSSYCWVSL
jgi:hypothetical protein